MDYAEELWAKGQRVQDALTRLGGSRVQVEEILGASQPLHYRNKSQYPVSPDGKVGFYRARTHCVTDLTACLIQKPRRCRRRGPADLPGGVSGAGLR